jgi:hypothetical protein
MLNEFASNGLASEPLVILDKRDNLFDLLAGHSRKPFEEIINLRAAFKVLKQRLDRDARRFE